MTYVFRSVRKRKGTYKGSETVCNGERNSRDARNGGEVEGKANVVSGRKDEAQVCCETVSVVGYVYISG